jgi:hypothetical protein
MGGPSGSVETSGAARPAGQNETSHHPSGKAAKSGAATSKPNEASGQSSNNVTPGLCVAQSDTWVQPADVHNGSAVQKSSSANSPAQLGTIACQMSNDPFGAGEQALRERIDDAIGSIDHLRIPGDMLPAIEANLLAQLPNNSRFAKIVREQAQRWTLQWQAEGRTHEVWDRLLALSKACGWQGIKKEVTRQIAMLAETSPSVAAINYYRSMLLTQWPGEPTLPPQFREAVDGATKQFLEKPAIAAQKVGQTYFEKGAVAAAALLREFTATADPLTAALTFRNAQTMIALIADDVFASTLSTPDKLTIFRDLSAACDNASRSNAAASFVHAVADKLISKLLDPKTPRLSCQFVALAVRQSVAEGNATLAFELMERLQNNRPFIMNVAGLGSCGWNYRSQRANP